MGPTYNLEFFGCFSLKRYEDLQMSSNRCNMRNCAQSDRQVTPKVIPNDPESVQWTPTGDEWSPMTLQRRPNGPPKVTNGAPMAVQRHPRQPKGPQRPPKTGQKSPMKPKTQKNAIMASFRIQYPHFNVPSGISNINFKTSR